MSARHIAKQLINLLGYQTSATKINPQYRCREEGCNQWVSSSHEHLRQPEHAHQQPPPPLPLPRLEFHLLLQLEPPPPACSRLPPIIRFDGLYVERQYLPIDVVLSPINWRRSSIHEQQPTLANRCAPRSIWWVTHDRDPESPWIRPLLQLVEGQLCFLAMPQILPHCAPKFAHYMPDGSVLSPWWNSSVMHMQTLCVTWSINRVLVWN